jgi:hypothetical protein
MQCLPCWVSLLRVHHWPAVPCLTGCVLDLPRRLWLPTQRSGALADDHLPDQVCHCIAGSPAQPDELAQDPQAHLWEPFARSQACPAECLAHLLMALVCQAKRRDHLLLEPDQRSHRLVDLEEDVVWLRVRERRGLSSLAVRTCLAHVHGVPRLVRHPLRVAVGRRSWTGLAGAKWLEPGWHG